MKTTNTSFFARNRKALYIGAGVLGTVGAAVAFGYTGQGQKVLEIVTTKIKDLFADAAAGAATETAEKIEGGEQTEQTEQEPSLNEGNPAPAVEAPKSDADQIAEDTTEALGGDSEESQAAAEAAKATK